MLLLNNLTKPRSQHLIPIEFEKPKFISEFALHNGLPFEVKLPDYPLDIRRMTSEQLNAEMEKGYADIQAGRTRPASDVFADIRKEYGI